MVGDSAFVPDAVGFAVGHAFVQQIVGAKPAFAQLEQFSGHIRLWAFAQMQNQYTAFFQPLAGLTQN